MRSSSYLCDKISNERDIRVELLQTPANVANHRKDVATAQEMNHSVQESLLQLQLSEEKDKPGTQSVTAKQQWKKQHEGDTHLLHDIQLGVLRLKQLDEQLEDLWVQQLVTRADLRGRGFHVYIRRP